MMGPSGFGAVRLCAALAIVLCVGSASSSPPTVEYKDCDDDGAILMGDNSTLCNLLVLGDAQLNPVLFPTGIGGRYVVMPTCRNGKPFYSRVEPASDPRYIMYNPLFKDWTIKSSNLTHDEGIIAYGGDGGGLGFVEARPNLVTVMDWYLLATGVIDGTGTQRNPDGAPPQEKFVAAEALQVQCEDALCEIGDCAGDCPPCGPDGPAPHGPPPPPTPDSRAVSELQDEIRRRRHRNVTVLDDWDGNGTADAALTPLSGAVVAWLVILSVAAAVGGPAIVYWRIKHASGALGAFSVVDRGLELRP